MKLTDTQIAALLRLDAGRHYDSRAVELPMRTARALKDRGLVRQATERTILTKPRPRWYLTSAGKSYLAVYGHAYPWGKIRRVHRVGDYAIVESDRTRPANVPERDWTPSVSFHPFERDATDTWHDSCHGYDSLDEALVACVVRHHIRLRRGESAAANERATGYIMKMIEADHEGEE